MIDPATRPADDRKSPARRPRLGFLGLGWIGRHRLAAVAESGLVEIAAIADTVPDRRASAAEVAPRAELVDSLEALLTLDLDGVVIATPSALHADQAVAAFDCGLAVFCQKPLGRTAAETRRVVDAARAAGRLLGVDLSYRHADSIRRVADVIRSGEIGPVYAADLVFHNAYGPDQAWFYDPLLAGGGCVIDLGIHLIDLALWVLDCPAVTNVDGRLFAQGRPITGDAGQVEDYATAQIDLATGSSIRIACSWRLPAGRDAVISGHFYGPAGGVSFENVDGSFYDFRAERFRGTSREVLVEPPDAWGGRAIVEWAGRLGRGDRFDPAAQDLVEVAAVIDRIYGR